MISDYLAPIEAYTGLSITQLIMGAILVVVTLIFLLKR